MEKGAGGRWGGGLTSLIKSRLVYTVVSCGDQREEGRGGCKQNVVQPGADVRETGIKKQRRQSGSLDVFTDGLRLKSETFTFCSPLFPKILVAPSLSHSLSFLCVCCLNPSISIRMQQTLKCCLCRHAVQTVPTVCIEFSGDRSGPTSARGFKLSLYVHTPVAGCWYM